MPINRRRCLSTRRESIEEFTVIATPSGRHAQTSGWYGIVLTRKAYWSNRIGKPNRPVQPNNSHVVDEVFELFWVLKIDYASAFFSRSVPDRPGMSARDYRPIRHIAKANSEKRRHVSFSIHRQLEHAHFGSAVTQWAAVKTKSLSSTFSWTLTKVPPQKCQSCPGLLVRKLTCHGQECRTASVPPMILLEGIYGWYWLACRPQPTPR